MAKEILTDKDLNDINDALKVIDDAKVLITKSKQAGFDMTQYEKEINEQEKKLRGIKQTFFAGR